MVTLIVILIHKTYENAWNIVVKQVTVEGCWLFQGFLKKSPYRFIEKQVAVNLFTDSYLYCVSFLPCAM